MKNKYGLSRNIPEDIKRKVRKKCGFGCIICGSALCDYEHVDPLFAECTTHSPDGIVLLCVKCHAEVTRNFLSKEYVKKHIAKPKATELGYSHEFLRYCGSSPKIKIGNLMFDNCSIPVSVDDYPLIEFSESSDPNAPFELSATFFDKQGNPILAIDRNHWKINAGSWDATLSSGTILIKDSISTQCLKMNLIGAGFVEISELNMNYLGRNIQIVDGRVQKSINGRPVFSMNNMVFVGFKNGVSL